MAPSKTIKLNTGQEMPTIGLGTGMANKEEMRNALRVALDHGYRSIDTACLYTNEGPIGDVLQEYFTKGKLKREDVFVTTKLPAIANRPADVNRFLTMSLKKLKLDYIDQYLIHHPFGLKYIADDNLYAKNEGDEGSHIDNDTDLVALWKALEKEVKAGRVKSLGMSNFNKEQTERILKIAEYPPAVNQVEMHAYFPQHELLEFSNKLGIVLVAYCPIGGPWTSEGKTLSLLQDPVVNKLAANHKRTAGQILLRYLVQRGVVVIPKSATKERIIANYDVWDFELTKADMEKLNKLDKKEKGRIFHFKELFKGCENHHEYPFHAKF